MVSGNAPHFTGVAACVPCAFLRQPLDMLWPALAEGPPAKKLTPARSVLMRKLCQALPFTYVLSLLFTEGRGGPTKSRPRFSKMEPLFCVCTTERIISNAGDCHGMPELE